MMACASPTWSVVPCFIYSNKSIVSKIAVILTNGSARAADSIFWIVIDNLVSFLAGDEAVLGAALHSILTLAQVTLSLLPCL